VCSRQQNAFFHEDGPPVTAGITGHFIDAVRDFDEEREEEEAAGGTGGEGRGAEDEAMGGGVGGGA